MIVAIVLPLTVMFLIRVAISPSKRGEGSGFWELLREALRLIIQLSRAISRTDGASHSWVTWLLLLRDPSNRGRVRVSRTHISL